MLQYRVSKASKTIRPKIIATAQIRFFQLHSLRWIHTNTHTFTVSEYVNTWTPIGTMRNGFTKSLSTS